MTNAQEDRAEIVRACFKSYVDKDRATIEKTRPPPRPGHRTCPAFRPRLSPSARSTCFSMKVSNIPAAWPAPGFRWNCMSSRVLSTVRASSWTHRSRSWRMICACGRWRAGLA